MAVCAPRLLWVHGVLQILNGNSSLGSGLNYRCGLVSTLRLHGSQSETKGQHSVNILLLAIESLKKHKDHCAKSQRLVLLVMRRMRVIVNVRVGHELCFSQQGQRS